MDTRIDVHRILGLEQGDAHILRNAGGLVTDDVIRSVTVSQTKLGTDEVILLMHTDCGQGFPDLDQALSDGLATLARSIPNADKIKGFIYDVETDALR